MLLTWLVVSLRSAGFSPCNMHACGIFASLEGPGCLSKIYICSVTESPINQHNIIFLTSGHFVVAPSGHHYLEDIREEQARSQILFGVLTPQYLLIHSLA
ncbi:hypothetical protein B0O99DRAFT_604159 [Bisporella sp. PMI_857]|nr:hypothetical protein B0O99DRAFT_604159 [Bisporella sp. PMI_857]